MLRTLVFAGIAAIAGRKLYKSGALERFGDDLKRRADEARGRVEERRGSVASAAPAPAPVTPRSTVSPVA